VNSARNLCFSGVIFCSERKQDKTKQNKQQYGNKAIVMAKKGWGDANVTLKKIHLEFFFNTI
jgi:hypothetical protein